MVLNSKCFVHQKFTPQRVESMHVHRKYQENICECGKNSEQNGERQVNANLPSYGRKNENDQEFMAPGIYLD